MDTKGNTASESSTGDAAPAPAGPAANLPATGTAPTPAPQPPKPTPERAADAATADTAARAQAAQDEEARQAAEQAAAGKAAAAEIAGDVPQPAAELGTAPSSDPAPISQPVMPMPAITGVGEAVRLASGHTLTGAVAKLWNKAVEGATIAEMRLASGIHDVEEHLRRWEREGIATFEGRETEHGRIVRAMETCED